MNKVCKLLLLLGLVLSATWAAAVDNSAEGGKEMVQAMVKQVPGDFVAVDIDTFIVAEKGKVPKGKKMIKMAEPISFLASVKRLPEQRDMSYVYTALEVAGVQPMPKVEHRMFIETAAGRIFPVYVESIAAEKFVANLHVDEHVRLLGYHLYNYAKGPAIMVVDYQRPELH